MLLIIQGSQVKLKFILYVDQLTGIVGDTGETKQRDIGGHVTDDPTTFPAASKEVEATHGDIGSNLHSFEGHHRVHLLTADNSAIAGKN